MKFVRSKREAPEAKAKTAKAPTSPRQKKPQKKPGKAGNSDKARGKQKFVLIIGDEGAILVYMRGATVVRRLFAASPQPDHASAILELMNANPKVPLAILADVIDQQYVRHSFPPVSALSVNNLVKRRIERDFQAEDITGALRLGREKTGRKEWQYLLIALANTPLMQQWLDLLVEQPNQMEGIFLAPVEAQEYINTLHKSLTEEKSLPWQLLVSHHKVSGFRQAVLKNGKLVFTRVTQAIDDAVPAVIAGNIEQEIMNTLEYLRRLGFLENNTLEMIVITSQEVQEVLDINRFKAGQSWVLTPLTVAEGLGLEQAALTADRFGDVVMAAAFARSKKHVLKLLTAYGHKLAQLYTARVGIKVLGALAMLALLGMSGMNLVQALTDSSAASDTEDKRRPLQSQLESVRKAINGLNKDVAFKSAVMLTYDAYLKDVHAPSEFVDTLAPLLVPESRVRKLNWGVPVAGATSVVPTAPGAGKAPLEIRVEFEFVGQFADNDQLAKFVENFVANLKQKMPTYTITNEPYPWQGKTQNNVEISFDQQQQQPAQTQDSENKVVLIFQGPKAVAPAGMSAAPSPGGPGGPPPANAMGGSR